MASWAQADTKLLGVAYDDVSSKLFDDGIHWTGHQYWNKIKSLKTLYCQAKDPNSQTGKNLRNSLDYKQFDWLRSRAPNMEAI